MLTPVATVVVVSIAISTDVLSFGGSWAAGVHATAWSCVHVCMQFPDVICMFIHITGRLGNTCVACMLMHQSHDPDHLRVFWGEVPYEGPQPGVRVPAQQSHLARWRIKTIEPHMAQLKGRTKGKQMADAADTRLPTVLNASDKHVLARAHAHALNCNR